MKRESTPFINQMSAVFVMQHISYIRLRRQSWTLLNDKRCYSHLYNQCSLHSTCSCFILLETLIAKHSFVKHTLVVKNVHCKFIFVMTSSIILFICATLMNLFFMATSNGILSSLMICYQIMKKCSSATMTIYRLTIHFFKMHLIWMI